MPRAQKKVNHDDKNTKESENIQHKELNDSTISDITKNIEALNKMTKINEMMEEHTLIKTRIVKLLDEIDRLRIRVNNMENIDAVSNVDTFDETFVSNTLNDIDDEVAMFDQENDLYKSVDLYEAIVKKIGLCSYVLNNSEMKTMLCGK